MPDASQRLASKEAILAHPFLQQAPDAVASWEQVSQNSNQDSELLQNMGLTENVYIKELHKLIELQKEEQIDEDDDDEE